ncbi:MAG TPA: Lrp/AsnC family transcriptional regulator [Blastocatellia bacterium]|jgi:Lrp/AsnC family leucine-responsive transcriptional regulator
MINEIDKQILMILQENARTPNAEIARQVGLVPSAILERIRKLEERGVIQGYGARLNGRALGLGLLAFVLVRTDELSVEDEAAKALAKMPEVLEVHHIAGEDCFLVKVRTADTEALGRLLREQIGAIKSVRSTRTTIVLHTAKETGALPVQDFIQEGEVD